MIFQLFGVSSEAYKNNNLIKIEYFYRIYSGLLGLKGRSTTRKKIRYPSASTIIVCPGIMQYKI